MYDVKDERVNYIINECSKLALRECKVSYDWVGNFGRDEHSTNLPNGISTNKNQKLKIH